MPVKFTASWTQAQFLRCIARYVLLGGGLGSGKTAGGAVKAIQKIGAGESGIVVAPNFPHFTRSTWPEFSKWLPWSRVKNSHLEHPYTQRKELLLDINGKEVRILYGGIDEPKSWRGPTVNWFWFDEGAMRKNRDAFDVLCGRIRTGFRPQGWVTTTPSGVNHWLYDVFVKQDFDREFLDAFKKRAHIYDGKLVDRFHCDTSENIHNDPLYYASLLTTYRGKFREQEVGGLFVSLEGLVWEDFSEKLNVTPDADYVSGVPVEWWIDDGYTRKHPRVFLLVQEIPPYINVFDEYVIIYEKAEVSIENVLNKGWPKAKVAYIDSSAAELRGRLEEQEVDTVGATHKIEEGIKHVAPFILSGENIRHLRFHPRCEFSPVSMASYNRDIRTNKPQALGDDVPDCVRYGLWFKDVLDIIEEGRFQEKVKERKTKELLNAQPHTNQFF